MKEDYSRSRGLCGLVEGPLPRRWAAEQPVRHSPGMTWRASPVRSSSGQLALRLGRLHADAQADVARGGNRIGVAVEEAADEIGAMLLPFAPLGFGRGVYPERSRGGSGRQ